MNKINPDPADDLATGRKWLNDAAQLFDTQVVDSNRAYTAAVIGNGFIGLAHTAASLASMTEVSQVRSAILSLSDEPESTLGEAIAREQRAVAEALPHDDEPMHILGPDPDGSCPACRALGGDDEATEGAAPKPTCSFVHEDKRCVFAPGHHQLWHHLEDGSEVNDAGEPMHAVDCHGCDGPGVVPCAADEVVGGFAMRDGEPIKDLRGGDRG